MHAARQVARMGIVSRASLAAARVVPSHVSVPAVAPLRAYSGRVPGDFAEQAYHVLFKKNISYIMYVLLGAIVLETFYGNIGNAVWNAANHGKTFETVDWSKFRSPLEDAEEE
jgi:hypothetical protein